MTLQLPAGRWSPPHGKSSSLPPSRALPEARRRGPCGHQLAHERTRPPGSARPPRASSRARTRGGFLSPHPVSARPPHPTPHPAAQAPPPRPGCGARATGSHFKAELEVTGERSASAVRSRLSALAAAEWPECRSRRPQPATPRESSLPSAPTHPCADAARAPAAPRLGSWARFSRAARSGTGLQGSSEEPVRDPGGAGG